MKSNSKCGVDYKFSEDGYLVQILGRRPRAWDARRVRRGFAQTRVVQVSSFKLFQNLWQEQQTMPALSQQRSRCKTVICRGRDEKTTAERTSPFLMRKQVTIPLSEPTKTCNNRGVSAVQKAETHDVDSIRIKQNFTAQHTIKPSWSSSCPMAEATPNFSL
eukprot:184138-Rhodomonas_salina.2